MQVDLNVLVDYRWPEILHQIPAFVRAVPSPSDLCDLLFALRPGSIVSAGGAYAGILTLAIPQGGHNVAAAVLTAADAPSIHEDKVDAVCESIRTAVEELPGGREKYLTVIATAYARFGFKQGYDPAHLDHVTNWP